MNLLKQLWSDESGMILSSEAVLVGTVGVIGATVGLKAMGESVNAEMTDIARALRSLDQSYEIRGMKGCGACTAGSTFKQQDVATSLKELDVVVDKEKAAAAKREAELMERLKRQQRDAEQTKPEAKKPEQKKPEPKKPAPKKKSDDKKRPSQSSISPASGEIIL